MSASRPVASVTSRDVARAANVSQALVSRAFTGHGRIAPETRERILEAARTIGWQPNALARSMVTGDAPLIAIITTRLNFEWRAQVLSHLLKAIEDWQLKPLLFYADDDREVDRLLGETISWRTRGVIVTAGSISPGRAGDILARGQFLVALNRSANHAGAFSVATDNLFGGGHAARLLLREGRRKFLVLAGPEDSWASATRTQGFLDALAEAGAEATIWHNASMSVEDGWRSAERLMEIEGARRIEAVFSTNDAMALGFMDCVRTKISIPGDLSLIGFDNLPASSWLPYQLTTFEQPLGEMVGRVLGHIDTHMDEQTGAFVPVDTPPHRIGENGVLYCAPELITRETTGGAK